MAENKKLIAAAFAAGLAGGGAGGDQLAQQEIDAANARVDEVQAVVEQIDVHSPTILSYVQQATDLAIRDTLDQKMVADRAVQMTQMVAVMRQSLGPTDNAKLTDLHLALAELAGPEWVDWYANAFAVHLQAQIAVGMAVGNLSPDQLVRLSDVVNAMEMTTQFIIPPRPVELDMADTAAEAALREDSAMRAQEQEARGEEFQE